MYNTIYESFQQYAGAVLQSRALVDARDCLKPSARQILYSMYRNDFVFSKKTKKTAAAVGQAMKEFYIHGDSSCVGIIMRFGQPFSTRYPLITINGNYGTLMESGDWAAQRYTESKLSGLSDKLFEDIDKDTIREWRDNYDNTLQYPSVMPSKGFYNIVNGTMGIGVGAAASIPSTNLKEVNAALVKLLYNPDIDFDEIYCAPDFPTGGYLLNGSEVKESMKNGNGAACKIRSVVEYDAKDRCLVVTEIPYSVYTNTICSQLNQILESEDNPGIDYFKDLTNKNPLIKIYLTKKGNPDKVLKYLFKNTSLEYYFPINLTMLEMGRYPRVFTWKEALTQYLNHQIEVYTRGFEFDVKKIQDRIHILEGLLIALASIDEVIQTIKTSSSSKEANQKLQENYLLDEIQAKAVLDMKLGRLAALEVEKLLEEKSKLEIEANKICKILENELLLKKEIEKDLVETAKIFGDARRTKVLDIETENDEPTEIRTLSVSLTNKNNLLTSESSMLLTQRRGGVGSKFKLDKDEYVISTSNIESNESILIFTDKGNFYSIAATSLQVDEKIPIEALCELKMTESVCALTSYNKNNSKQYILFFTKNGLMKKSLLSDYSSKRANGAKAIDLAAGDEIRSVLFVNDEKVGILSRNGYFIICRTDEVNPIGRVAKGVKAIKLGDDDTLAAAHIIPESYKEIVSVSSKGYIKRSSSNEFSVSSRYTKGNKIQKVENDFIVDFAPIEYDREIGVVSDKAQIRIKVDEIPLLSKAAQGLKAINLGANGVVRNLSKFQ